MNALDDLPLDPSRAGQGPPVLDTPPSPWPRAALFLLLAAVVAAGGWWAYSRTRSTLAEPSSGTTSGAAAATPAEAAAPAVTLPPLEQMDPVVRGLLRALGSHPELLKWLATDDLAGGIATAVDRLSQGQSPGRDLRVLRPEAPFAVTRRGGGYRVDAATYARYDALAGAVASVDAERLARAFTTLQPRLAEAYMRQGHPEGGFDAAVRRAIAVVASTPDLPPDAGLVPGVGGYVYADGELERLPAAQKHLLRMGPDNARLVRDAARRFGAALDAAASTTR